MTAAPDDSFIGTVIDGKYRVESLLGKGAMGAVYKATQLNLDRFVAVKILLEKEAGSRGAAERFRREAMAIARLRHPHIIAIYDLGLSPQVGLYIAIEYLVGRSLRAEIKSKGRLEPGAAVDLMRQICSAVYAANEAGVIHRDLKPDNVFLEDVDGMLEAKVLDFGIAKLRTEATDPDADLTVLGAVVGTPRYMSPEQCRGKPADARSDVYALACTLYAMLTGDAPFVGPDSTTVMRMQVDAPPVPPSARVPGLDPAIDEVVLRALAKDPEARFQTAAELGRALARSDTGGSDTRRFAAGDLVRSDRSSTSLTAAAEVTCESGTSPTAPPDNLPQELATFVGRERELEQLGAELRNPQMRLLTLTGPGGIGKTRLALRCATEALRAFPDGTWLVELASVADPSNVARVVASVLGVREEPGRTLVATLGDALKTKEALLVLDNCEHLVEACAEVVQVLLRACGHLRVLATSRESLGVPGEAVFPLHPLGLPAANATSPENAREAESVRLFVERAQGANRGFELTERNTEEVVKICRWLEGIPLALELAAARVKVLTIEQICAKMGDRFRLLAAGGRATVGRQQTLRATIDWSYDLLAESERILLNRLSVFVGGATLEAVVTVCAGDGLDEFEIIDALTRLADKSLVAVSSAHVEARYVLLETIRQYAMEKLEESGQSDQSRRRHRDFFLAAVESKGSRLRTSEGTSNRAILTTEIENLRAALAWSRDEAGDGVPFLRLAVGLHVFFYERSDVTEGRAWIEQALLRAGPGAPPELRARALAYAGTIATDQGDLEAAHAHHSEALAVYRASGNTKGIASCLHNLALVLQLWGMFAEAQRYFQESYTLYLELGSAEMCGTSLVGQGNLAVDIGEWGRADALLAEAYELFGSTGDAYGALMARKSQAYAAFWRGDLDRLEALLEETLVLAREVENRHAVAAVDLLRGGAAVERRELDRAEVLIAKALAEMRDIGDVESSGHALMYLARSARLRGAVDRAARPLRESLELRVRMRDGLREADCLSEVAALALARGEAATAAKLLGAVRGIRERTGAAQQPIERGVNDAARAGSEAALGDAEFREAEEAGARLALTEVRALAFDVLS